MMTGRKKRRLHQRLVLLALAFMTLIPIQGLPLWRYIFGLTGDISPTTWLLFSFWFVFPDIFCYWCADELPIRRRLYLFFGLMVLYAMTLGIGSLDPYAWGYQPWGMLAALGAWVAWHGRTAPGLTMVLALDLGLYARHGLTSDNLWDYLSDPLVFIALGVSLIRDLKSHRSQADLDPQ